MLPLGVGFMVQKLACESVQAVLWLGEKLVSYSTVFPYTIPSVVEDTSSIEREGNNTAIYEKGNFPSRCRTAFFYLIRTNKLYPWMDTGRAKFAFSGLGHEFRFSSNLLSTKQAVRTFSKWSIIDRASSRVYDNAFSPDRTEAFWGKSEAGQHGKQYVQKAIKQFN